MPAPFSPSAPPSHPRPGSASVRTRNAARIRRGRTLVAAGAPGFAVFVQTLFQVATAWVDILTLDVPSLDVLSWRLGVAGIFGLPLLFGLRTLRSVAPEEEYPDADRPPAHRRGPSPGELGWARPILISFLAAGLLFPALGMVARLADGGEHEVARASLRRLAAAQEAYFDVNYHYAVDIGALDWTPEPGHGLMLTASTEGWSTRLVSADGRHGCVAYYGRVAGAPVTPGGRTPGEPNRIVCDDF